jgi:hypothetical protein
VQSKPVRKPFSVHSNMERKQAMQENLMLSQVGTWQACVQALHAHLHAHASDQCLLWVNPAQIDLFADNAWVQENRVRVPIQHERFDAQVAPYLLALELKNSSQADIFEQSVQAAYEAWELPSLQAYQGQPIAGWVLTTGTARALASYWANYNHLHAVDSFTKLLRFHDPSVREWLWPTLSATQQAQLLGPARQLIAIDRQQRPMLHSQPEAAKQVDDTKLRLSPAQWQQVDDYAILHEAWLAQASAQAGAQGDTHWRQTLPANWHQGVLRALQQATGYGIDGPQDRVLFAQHAIQIGPEFHAHPLLKSVWQKTQAGDFYGGALEAITAQPANGLQNYLNTPNTPVF